MEREFQLLEFSTRVGQRVDSGLSVMVPRGKNVARKEESRAFWCPWIRSGGVSSMGTV